MPPTVIDIPHQLDRATVRERMKGRVDRIPDFMPGGVANVESHWPSEDRLALKVQAMGQSIDASVDIHDDRLHIEMDLPGMLAFVAPMIEGAIRANADKMLRLPGKDA